MALRFTDNNLLVTTALPAAAANSSSASIDLGSVSPGVAMEKIDVLLTCPATPALVDDKTITFTFQDSADNSTFAAIPELATKVTTGAGGAGAAAFEQRVKLPPSVRRYIRVNAAVLAAGGSNIAVSHTLKLQF